MKKNISDAIELRNSKRIFLFEDKSYQPEVLIGLIKEAHYLDLKDKQRIVVGTEYVPLDLYADFNSKKEPKNEIKTLTYKQIKDFYMKYKYNHYEGEAPLLSSDLEKAIFTKV